MSSSHTSRIPIRLPRADLLAFGKALKNSFSRQQVMEKQLLPGDIAIEHRCEFGIGHGCNHKTLGTSGIQ